MTDVTPGTPGGNPQRPGAIDPQTLGAIAYLCGLLTGLVVLLIERNDREVKFHAWQSIFLNIAMIFFFIICNILSLIPVLGLLFVALTMLASVGYLVITVVCAVKALQGARFELPVLTDLAEKQAVK